MPGGSAVPVPSELAVMVSNRAKQSGHNIHPQCLDVYIVQVGLKLVRREDHEKMEQQSDYIKQLESLLAELQSDADIAMEKR